MCSPGLVPSAVSHTADGVHDQIKDLPTEGSFEYLSTLLAVITGAMLNQVGLKRLDEYDVVGAIYDLRTDVREAFNKKHAEYLDSLRS